MRIGIDARMLGSGFGLGRYVQQLVTLLEQHDRENEYVIFLRKENWGSYIPKEKNFSRVQADIPWYSVREQVALTHIIKKQHLDLMHFLHSNVPLNYTDPFVVTIHDLIMYHYPRPEATTRGKAIFWLKDKAHRVVLKHAIEKSRHIITTSEFTSADIARHFDIKKEKMTRVYQSPFIEQAVRHDPQEKTVLNTHGIRNTYAMYVGAAYPHKNVEQLLRAWQIFVEEHGEDVQLVLVGKDDYFWRRLKESDLYLDTPQVVHTGYVSDTELRSLYAHASLYVFPSLYEGFGLPPLEAMASNVPVASSDASCLPEVLADAAVYFDPNNPAHVADTIASVIENPDLQMQLQQAGRERVRELSREKFVEGTRGVYSGVESV